jgi:hypothetical protein
MRAFLEVPAGIIDAGRGEGCSEGRSEGREGRARAHVKVRVKTYARGQDAPGAAACSTR